VYVAVKIAQAVIPQRKLLLGDFMNREVGISPKTINAMASDRFAQMHTDLDTAHGLPTAAKSGLPLKNRLREEPPG
jgi:hypothetical protein